MAIDYKKFNNQLEEEKKLLEKELETVGIRNPNNPTDWEAAVTAAPSSQADDNVAADRIEDYEENRAIVSTLEVRYRDVKNALEKISKGTYGICEIGGEEIDIERLEANPSARTCREHME